MKWDVEFVIRSTIATAKKVSFAHLIANRRSPKALNLDVNRDVSTTFVLSIGDWRVVYLRFYDLHVMTKSWNYCWIRTTFDLMLKIRFDSIQMQNIYNETIQQALNFLALVVIAWQSLKL